MAIGLLTVLIDQKIQTILNHQSPLENSSLQITTQAGQRQSQTLPTKQYFQYSEQLWSAYPSNSGDFQHLQQQLIRVQAIMRRYEIHLSIGNLREYKHHPSSANYYLCVQNEFREREYSFCQNIILTEGLFTFEVPSEIKLLQIWNYDKRKKVATVMLKREKETCLFSYQFKNFNLRLIIKSFNLLLDCHELKMFKKESLRTDESQNEHNMSDECEV